MSNAQDRVDLRGSWKSQVYTLKDGTRHEVPGLIFFTTRDWTTLYFVLADGKPQRGSGEGGTYTLAGNELVFTHIYHLSAASEVTGLPPAPLRMEIHKAAEAPTERCTVEVSGDRMTIHFPSGNHIAFARSSGF